MLCDEKCAGLGPEWCFTYRQTAVELTHQPRSPTSPFIASAELYENPALLPRLCEWPRDF